MKKYLIEVPIIFIMAIAILMGTFHMKDKEQMTPFEFSTIVPETTEVTSEVPETTTSDTFTITLSFVGDCLLATNHGQSYTNCFRDVADEKDPSYFFMQVQDYFLKDDFSIADCENVFSDSTDLSVSDKGQYDDPDVEAYWFKSKAANAEIFKAGGIEYVSIENNHINDYGAKGADDTRAALHAAGVEWGEDGKILYMEKNGYKLALICASMYSEYFINNIIDEIEIASENSDYQIVYFHGGKEAIHKPEDWKVTACHNLIDSGADLVIGDHPHVLQPMEEYNGATIIYSMGNFIFGGNRQPQNRTIIYQHTLTITKDELTLQEGTMIPCYVYTGNTNNWQPDIITDETQKQKVLDFMNWKTDSPL